MRLWGGLPSGWVTLLVGAVGGWCMLVFAISRVGCRAILGLAREIFLPRDAE